METFLHSLVHLGPFPSVGKSSFFVLMDGFKETIFSAAVSATIPGEQMGAPTAPTCNSLGPVIVSFISRTVDFITR